MILTVGRRWGSSGMRGLWRCLVRMDGRGWVVGCGCRHDLLIDLLLFFMIIEVAVHVIKDNEAF